MNNPATYGNFQFIILAPQELNEACRLIEPGLQTIQRKAAINWEVSDLLMQVQANLATLIVIYSGDRYAGFIIVRHSYLGYPNRHYLVVPAMYGEPWCFKEGQDIKAATDEWLEQFGKEYKCFGILQKIVRMGWGRPLEKLGYKKVEEAWLKELPKEV